MSSSIPAGMHRQPGLLIRRAGACPLGLCVECAQAVSVREQSIWCLEAEIGRASEARSLLALLSVLEDCSPASVGTCVSKTHWDRLSVSIGANGLAKLPSQPFANMGKLFLPNYVDRTGRSALSACALAEDATAVQLALSEIGCDVNYAAADSNLDTALIALIESIGPEEEDPAATTHAHAILEALLAGGARLDLRNAAGDTALTIAARRGLATATRVILTSATRRDLAKLQDVHAHLEPWGWLTGEMMGSPTALMEACRVCHVATVRVLLEFGARGDIQDGDRKSVV